jgi:hypothetical protein
MKAVVTLHMLQDHYCREVESYLCRKNDGHLIRIVGPSFELVSGWAARGIPLKLVFRGVDRCFERHYTRGPRRRPVRIDFCDADVLDVFDEWRRSVGVFLEKPAIGENLDTSAPTKPHHSLAAHLDRIVGRLVARQTDPATALLDTEISRTIERLDSLREVAPKARGAARARLIDELAVLDGALTVAAREGCPADVQAALARDAALDLEPFRERMAAAVYQQALDAATDRLVREKLGLPRIAYE